MASCRITESKNERLVELVNQFGQQEGLRRFLAEQAGYDFDVAETPPEDDLQFPITNKLAQALEQQIKLKYKIKNTLIFEARAARQAGRTSKATELSGKIQAVQTQITSLENQKRSLTGEIRLQTLVDISKIHLNWLDQLLSRETVMPSEIIEAYRLLDIWSNIDDILFDLTDDNTEIHPVIWAKIVSIKNDIISKKYDKKLFQLASELLSSTAEYDSVADFLQDMYRLKDISTANAYANFVADMGVKLLSKLDRLNKDAIARTQGELAKWLKRLEPIKELSKSGRLDIFWQRDENGKLTGGLVNRYSQEWYNNFFGRVKTFYQILTSKASLDKKLKTIKEFGIWLNTNTHYVDPRFFYVKDYVNHAGQNFAQFRHALELDLGKEEADALIQRAKDLYEQYLTDLQNYTDYITAQFEGEEDAEEKIKTKITKWKQYNNPAVWIDQLNGKTTEESNKYAIKQVHLNRYVYYTPKKNINGNPSKFYDEAFSAIMADPELSKAYNLIHEFMTEMLSYIPPYINLQSNFLPRVRKKFVEDLTVNGIFSALANAPMDFLDSITTSIDEVNIEDAQPYGEKFTKNIPVRYIGEFDEKEMSTDFSRILPLFAATALNYKWKSRIQDTIELTHKFLGDIAQSATRKEMTSDDLNNLRNALEWFMDTQLYQEKRLDEGVTNIKTFRGDKRVFIDIVEKDPRIVESIKKEYAFLLKDNPPERAAQILVENWGDRVVILNAKQKYEKLLQAADDLQRKFEDGEISEQVFEKSMQNIEQEAQQLGRNVVVSKLLDKLMTHNQAMAFWFNPFSAFNNFAFGVVSNLIWAADGTDFKVKDSIKSFWIMLRSAFNLKDGKLDKVAQLMAKFNMMAERLEYETSTIQNETMRKLKDIPYVLLRKGDYFIKGMTMVAAMMNKQIEVTVNGKKQTISLWEAFDEHGNWNTELYGENPDWNGDFSNPEENKEFVNFRLYVQALSTKLHGNFDPSTTPMYKKYVFLRMLGQFRASWVIEGIKDRFQAKRYDEYLGRYVEGRYVTAFHLGFKKSLKTLYKLTLDLMGIEQDWKYLPVRDRELIIANMRRNLMEIYLYMAMLATYLLIKASIDDDDDEDKWGTITALNTLNRVMQDTTFYLSPKTFIEIVKDPIPLLSLAIRAGRGVGAAMDLIMDSGELTDRQIELNWRKITSNFYFINQYNKFINMSSNLY